MTREDPFEQLIGLIGGDTDAPAFTHAWTANEPIPMADLEQMAADWKDGAALRRLREALPRAYYLDLYWSGRSEQPSVSIVNRTDSDDVLAWADADTIAEAADKCRAALDDASGGMA